MKFLFVELLNILYYSFRFDERKIRAIQSLKTFPSRIQRSVKLLPFEFVRYYLLNGIFLKAREFIFKPGL